MAQLPIRGMCKALAACTMAFTVGAVVNTCAAGASPRSATVLPVTPTSTRPASAVGARGQVLVQSALRDLGALGGGYGEGASDVSGSMVVGIW